MKSEINDIDCPMGFRGSLSLQSKREKAFSGVGYSPWQHLDHWALAFLCKPCLASIWAFTASTVARRFSLGGCVPQKLRFPACVRASSGRAKYFAPFTGSYPDAFAMRVPSVSLSSSYVWE